ncbi:MAG: hypothetical protein NWF00_08990 [Candidatus Bathyarchaeota archaeon]|nr:hypothetical protein [Candidatus Bathyarchaeota archaeon]
MTHEGKENQMDAENLKEILSVVSTEIPSMIKSVLSSVFSEEAGRNMGKAAAAYYSELKNGGLPDAVAVKLTEEYMRTFTSLGEMLRNATKGSWGGHGHGYHDDEFGELIKERIHRKVQEKKQQEEE